MPAVIAPSPAAASDDFLAQTSLVLSTIRDALRALAATLPGGVTKIRDLQDGFKIDVKLAWQLLRILKSRDVFELPAHLPAASSMKKFAVSARKRGSPEALVAAVEQAFAAFEAHVVMYAGTRSAFDSMLAPSAKGDAAAALESQYRRQLFEAWRYYYGVHIDALVHATIILPSRHPVPGGEFDYASVRSKMGLRRLRPGVAIGLDSSRLSPPQDPTVSFRHDPLDPEGYRQTGTAFLPGFSSYTPPMKTEVTPEGYTRSTLAGEGVGLPAAVNVAFGDVARNAPLSVYPDEQAVGFATIMQMLMPVELLMDDLLVHRPTFGPVSHEVATYADASHLTSTPTEKTHRRLANSLDTSTHLGTGEAALQAAGLAECPHYTEMLRFALARLGFDPAEFDVYRTRVEYPLSTTATVSRYRLAANHPLTAPTLTAQSLRAATPALQE